MELDLLTRLTDKRQHAILDIMKNENILPSEARDGICFTLTLHTLNKYVKNLDTPKQESFPVKYSKVYNHCMQSDSEWRKHNLKLADEFVIYYNHYSRGESQRDMIVNTITDCGFSVLNQGIRIEEQKRTIDAIIDLTRVLEMNENAAILLCINGENDRKESVGHTMALVRKGEDICFLDVTERVVEAKVADGKPEIAGKTRLTTEDFLTTRILVNRKHRSILNVTYAVILL